MRELWVVGCVCKYVMDEVRIFSYIFLSCSNKKEEIVVILFLLILVLGSEWMKMKMVCKGNLLI